MNKTALITGATSGFGEALAKKFAANSYNVIITGRRKERLEKLKVELERDNDCTAYTMNFDVRDKQKVKEVFHALPQEWRSIDVLVNNAGLASGLDKIQDGSSEDWDKMIDTNVKGLLYVSHEVIPLMTSRKTGHIINIGSTAGKEVYEKGNVYCASKHAVDAISKGMRIDLLGTGIKVTQICPGAAETEFSVVRFHGDQERARNAYSGYTPMSADDIAEVAFYTTTLPPHLCINDVVMTSVAQASSFYIRRD